MGQKISTMIKKSDEMYLIVGANGFIGSYAIRAILEKTSAVILAADKNIAGKENEERIQWVSCDVTVHEDIVRLNEICSRWKIVKVLYLAAYHAPDLVRQFPKIAWNINVTALADFVNTMDNITCLFYSSTEMVYGAGHLNEKFKEESQLAPVNLYGKNKVVAEAIVKGYGYNVLRFPFLIGPSIVEGRKSFYDLIVETINSGNSIEMFSDALKTALDFETLANTVICLMKAYNSDMPQTLNIAGDEVLSKYDIGLMIAEKYNCDSNLIVPISVNDDTKIFVEKRADCTLLDNSLVKKVLGLDVLKLNF